VAAFAPVVLFPAGNTPAARGAVLTAVVVLAVAAALFAGLLVAVRCAGLITGERERQTWDLLLLAPLDTKTILRGKLWGVLDSARPYLLAYLAAAAPLALLAGLPALVCVALVWLASWLLLYFTAATGIECSVRAVSTWRGLLSALLSSFRMVVERFVGIGLPLGLLGGALGALLELVVGWGVFVVLGFSLPAVAVTALLLLAQAEHQLDQAEKHIAGQERILQAEKRLPGR
jgi:hypothetical protein